MKFFNGFAILAISTIAAAHCMKKGQQLSASLISEPSDEMLPGSNLVYYCTDEDIESNILITNLDVFPGIPLAGDPLEVTISGILLKPLDPATYVIIRDVVTGEQLNSEQILFCPFLESIGYSCSTPSEPFDMEFEMMVETFPDVKSDNIYIELYESSGKQIMCVKSAYTLSYEVNQDTYTKELGAIDL
ncbi:unnamed protein product [Blumeria hordei]|uniref:MD-2-related lipid-recognition domain-containing protein n=1 Tax=Blumeria hordei TaxID=2867405 RepID=A0A383UT49_BLUHO|nr:unnamed protein product [Blumeria hordei]SZF04049.1 unnamed protein product [Blumeria hordei]